MAADNDTEMEQADPVININNYRKLVKNYVDLHMYNAALFWADKAAVLSNNDPRDVYWLAKCMYLLRQYHRAAHLIRNKDLDKIHIPCHYITVSCLFQAGEFAEALQTLESFDLDNQNVTNFNEILVDDLPKNKFLSAILLMKGRVFEAMDNRELASNCYCQALQHDVYCFEAFESLVQHQMLTAQEERDILSSLPLQDQCTELESEVLMTLYESRLKKYHTSLPEIAPKTIGVKNEPSKQEKSGGVLKPVNSISKKLGTSLDVEVTIAEKCYYNCDYSKCFKLTESILKRDPFHSGCLPVHIACLVELKESNKMFYLAHRLVDLYPEIALSWYAVGCYYYIIGKSDPARRYLSKATTLDRLFGPAWLAYGHSFAVENEHDQAMAAYFKASQLMKGCHLPLLYIGLECGLTNNESLADKFFHQAQEIAPEDPFVMHEMGVIAFKNFDYKNAEKHFKDALKKIRTVNSTTIPEKWEPLLNNLGHTCRKRKKYMEALQYHQEALVLAPQNASNYSSLGYVQALLGLTQDAVDSFHKALGLRKNDTFSITMLKYVIDELLDQVAPFEGAPDSLPTVLSFTDKSVIETDESKDTGDSQAILEDTPIGPNATLSDMSMSFD